MKKLKSLLKKLIYSFLCLLLALSLLEISIRLMGYVYLKRIYFTRETPQGKRKYLIYCLGDSHVFGVGAPAGMGFPHQLGKILNQYFSKDFAFEVKNFGVGGWNSSQVLEKLEQEAKLSPPHLAIIMVGGNNPWNYYKSNIFELIPQQSFLKNFYLKSILFLKNMRIYKLFLFVTRFHQSDFYKQKMVDAEMRKILNSEEYQFFLLRNDFKKMKECAQKYGFFILFLTYPDGRLNDIMLRVFNEEKLYYIDTSSIFQELSKRFKNLQLFYGNHPNLIGYRLIAISIVAYLKNRGLLPEQAKNYPLFLDYFFDFLRKASLEEIFQNLFEKEMAKNKIEELSSPQVLYEKAIIPSGDTIIELIFKDNSLFCIHYPHNLEQFDLRLVEKGADTKIITYLLGEPTSVDKFADRYNLFDQHWIYFSSGWNLNLFFKDHMLKYAYFDNRLDFAEGQLQILDDKPFIEEVKEIFGEPFATLTQGDTTTFDYYKPMRKLTINFQNNQVQSWQSEDTYSDFGVIFVMERVLRPGDPPTKVKNYLDKPEMELNISTTHSLAGWIKGHILVVFKDNSLYNLYIFAKKISTDPFSDPHGDNLEKIKLLFHSKDNPLLWHLNSAKFIDQIEGYNPNFSGGKVGNSIDPDNYFNLQSPSDL